MCEFWSCTNDIDMYIIFYYYFFYFVPNSLQQFVKGCGGFALEMGNAILNSLTSGRHGRMQETISRQKDETDKETNKPPTSTTGVCYYTCALSSLYKNSPRVGEREREEERGED